MVNAPGNRFWMNYKLNTGPTIPDSEYKADYGMPRWGGYALVKVKDGAELLDLVTARGCSTRSGRSRKEGRGRLTSLSGA